MNSCYEANRAFSLTERVVFYILLTLTIISGLTLLSRLNNKFLVTVPDHGGSVTEGVVGVPRFVNPVLVLSDPDRDLVSLVFSGLLKNTPDGKVVGDLSSEYTISPDGKTYTFTLRDDINFHDGEPVTTDDVEFTIERIQNPTVKSPKRAVWEGVLVKKIDSRHISFTLKQPYAPFIENFTLGILPRHIWKDVPPDEFSFSELNVDAVGSGPYKVQSVERNSYGLPVRYNLRSFSDYALGKPYLKNISLSFYQNEDDLFEDFKNGDIDSMSGVSPEHLNELVGSESKIISSPLPRVFGVFFNQNQATVLLNKEIREALSVAIDKDRIVKEVLYGYGTIIDSAVPISITSSATTTGLASLATTTKTISNTDNALGILSRAGWKLNAQTGVMEKKTNSGVVSLSFSIATGDAMELKQAAELIKEDWEKIGAAVELKVFEIGDLNQDVIRPRKFDVLFFGEIVGREFDLYPFWHSSQRNDPGLNIALYANITADKILESLRTTQSREERMKKALEFEKLLKTDMPAAFIYSPDFIYVTPNKLQNVDLGALTNPGDRFLNVNEWHTETNKVWKFFIQK
jgi:peptide/nickel transport system substrate-binding protein